MITNAWRTVTRHGEKAILCLLCMRLSFHPDDIAHKWCGGCLVALDTIPRTLEGPGPGEDGRDWVRRQEQANWQGALARAQRYREERIVSPLFSSDGGVS